LGEDEKPLKDERQKVLWGVLCLGLNPGSTTTFILFVTFTSLTCGELCKNRDVSVRAMCLASTLPFIGPSCYQKRRERGPHARTELGAGAADIRLPPSPSSGQSAIHVTAAQWSLCGNGPPGLSARVGRAQCSCNSRAASLPRRQQTELPKDSLSVWKNQLLTHQILKAVLFKSHFPIWSPSFAPHKECNLKQVTASFRALFYP